VSDREGYMVRKERVGDIKKKKMLKGDGESEIQ